MQLSTRGRYAVMAHFPGPSPYTIGKMVIDGVEMEGHDITVGEGATVEIDATLMAGVVSVDGVVKRKDGKPAPGAMVALVPRGMEARTHLERARQLRLDRDRQRRRDLARPARELFGLRRSRAARASHDQAGDRRQQHAEHPVDILVPHRGEHERQRRRLIPQVARERGRALGVVRRVEQQRAAVGEPAQVQFELREAQALFDRIRMPYIDATECSVEEIASRILDRLGLERRVRL